MQRVREQKKPWKGKGKEGKGKGKEGDAPGGGKGK